MISKSKVIWTIKELTKCLRLRQTNKFDCNIGVSGKRGNGKTQVKGNIVLMSDGFWGKVEDIKLGDEVISPQEDGSFTYEKVTHIHSRFEKEIYDIFEATRNKNLLYSCAWNHEIPLYRVSSKRIRENGKLTDKRTFGKKLCIRNARELSKHYTLSSHYTSFTSSAFEYKNIKKLVIDPYCLGVWLGDGHFTKDLGITSNDIEIINSFLGKYEIMNIMNKTGTTAKTYRFSILGNFSEHLKSLGLRYKNSGNKFIPKVCFQTSINDRLNLLAGLIDTDGFISKDNQITVCSKSFKLATDIKDLVFSLGGYSLIRKIYKNCQTRKEKKLYYDVSIQFKDPRIIPLRLKRKLDRLRIRKIDPTRIAIKSVRRKKGSMVYGFSINGKSKWYVTNNYMVTHNSTLLFKIFNSFKDEGFKPQKHQVYSREAVMDLLASQTLSFCWDDEAINSGYKRDFQNTGQKELIKLITNYRDNYNIYASALPFFYSLDKDMRELIFVHIHIIERGVAVILMPLEDQIHAKDPWDTIQNTKVEEREQKRIERNAELKFRYHRLSTFAGYLYFGPMTKKQERIYKQIKQVKRAKRFSGSINGEKEALTFLERTYNMLLEGKLTREGMRQAAYINGKKDSTVLSQLNVMLKDAGRSETVGLLLAESNLKIIHNKVKAPINDLLPDV